MARTETLRIVQFDDDTRELMQAIGGLIKEHEEGIRDIRSLLDEFRQIASFDISETVTDDGETATFTFADLE